MKVLATFSLLATCALATTSSSGQECLCTSDQSCWPDASDFSELQEQVSQPLIYPSPTASACYPPLDPSGNCTEVIENWTDGTWRASMPGSMEAPNFETVVFSNGTIAACYPNATITGTCEQGRVPVIGVDARSVADIQAGVNFAVKHNLKLVVKNTGHDYLGRSAAQGSFVVWTHNINNITFNPTFVPQGAPANETYAAVTLGAGVQWGDAYAAAYETGHMIVGAAIASIGTSGGWLAGGGHSALSPTYGLGVDNALEISVVLSSGEYLTVNNCQNSDLFWALRGGGGGTYGIVTSVTYRTYPTVPAQLYLFEANATNPAAMVELVGGLLQAQTQFTDDGWGGFGSMNNKSLNFFYMSPNMTSETANATTQPWTDYALSLEPLGISSSASIIPVPSWFDFFEEVFATVILTGANVMITSRLLSRDSVATEYVALAELLVTCQGLFNTVAGGKVNQIDPNSAGVNPAWRDAVVEAICGITWEDGASAAEIQGMIDELKTVIAAMNVLTPLDGAYFNEASLFEIDWQKTFFGSHYATLKDVKEKYDPLKLFVVAEGVGSEDWNKQLTCRSF